MRVLVPLALCVALGVASAQSPGKPKDLTKLEDASKSANAALEAAEASARRRYADLDAAVAAARGEHGARWIAELTRVLEPLGAMLEKDVAPKKGAAKAAAAAAVLKKEVAPALAKIEAPELKALTPYLASRLAAAPAEADLSPAALSAKAIAGKALEEILSAKPFHEIWNTSLAPVLTEADAYRKARSAALEARWDWDVGRDPVLAFQRGAPEGFARVPAGGYLRNAALGFGAAAPKFKQPVIVPNDVFIGLREVTHGEYYEWWKTLAADAREAHAPQKEDHSKMWSVPENEKDPAPSPEQLGKPVTGLKYPSVLAYCAGRGGRLPTEAEWCAAAGGRDGWKYPWGTEWKPDCANDAERGEGGLLNVGSLPSGRGPFGHLDLSGNADEWTATYETGKEVEPTKVDASVNVVVRGGNFTCSKDDVSNHWLWRRGPQFDASEKTGFRLAIEAPRKK
jgi:formylglycine-generating enzyme required for sulfatase activity